MSVNTVLSDLDWVTIIIYQAAVVALGVLAEIIGCKGQRGGEGGQYFLGGNPLGRPVIGLAMFAANSAGEDLRRVEGVRTALGPDIRIMTDAKGRWTWPLAIQIAARLVRFGIVWIKEPISFDDGGGFAVQGLQPRSVSTWLLRKPQYGQTGMPASNSLRTMDFSHERTCVGVVHQ